LSKARDFEIRTLRNVAITLDTVAGLSVDPAGYPNELTSLGMLKQGLLTLANNIKQREGRYAETVRDNIAFTMGSDDPDEWAELNLIGCMFHWFGVSACNYARLVGFIRGLERNHFTRRDLLVRQRFIDVKKSVNEYVDSIPELKDIVVWRNKVAGHFAITDPYKDDNITTLDLSVMFPVTFEHGIYTVGGLTLLKSNSTGSYTSQIPRWAVTRVFDTLIKRYWPDIVPVRADAISADESSPKP
jgi:hypothetical protein